MMWIRRHWLLCVIGSAALVLLAMGGLAFYLVSGVILCKDRVRGLAWSPDGKRLAYACNRAYVAAADWQGFAGTANVQTIAETELITSSLGLEDLLPAQVEWSPDSSNLAVFNSDFMFQGRIFSMDTPGMTALIRGRDSFHARFLGRRCQWAQDNRVLTLCWLEDSGTIITETRAPTIHDRNPITRMSRKLNAPPDRGTVHMLIGNANTEEDIFLPMVARWSPDAGRLLFVSRRNRQAEVWCFDVAASRDMGTLCPYDYLSPDRPRDFLGSPDGKSVAMLSLPAPGAAKESARIELWNVETRTRYQTLTMALPNLAGVLAQGIPPYPALLVPFDEAQGLNPRDFPHGGMPVDSLHHLAWSSDSKRIGGAFFIQKPFTFRVIVDPDLSDDPASQNFKECEVCWWSVAGGRLLAQKRVTSPGTIDRVRFSPGLEKIAVAHGVELDILGWDLSETLGNGLIITVHAPYAAMAP